MRTIISRLKRSTVAIAGIKPGLTKAKLPLTKAKLPRRPVGRRPAGSYDKFKQFRDEVCQVTPLEPEIICDGRSGWKMYVVRCQIPIR